MRNLTKTLALVSLLAPVCGYSLGIGDIKLHSALNQNLDAEIPLVVSTGDKASDIKANLAPPDKFDEAGVPWTSFLSKIKFETIVGANGSVIIKLSSSEAVKEPFLEFLLQVNWTKGSLYREFTVLLDPPTAYNQTVIPASPGPESYKPEQEVAPQYESMQKQQTRVERSISGAGEYGPTNRNDTLRKIAEQAAGQEDVSVEQMMIAMYEENPHAFYKKNVHSLLAGKILKIPERENLLKFSRKQALAEYHRQTKVWKNRLAPAPIEISSAKKETPDNQLTLAAPTEADVTESEIVAPENEPVTAKKKVDDTADKEVLSVVSPVNDALQDKVTELEKQLAIMQQILALKDQQLATLQNQFQEKPVVQAEPVLTTPGQTEVINPVVTRQQPVAQPVTRPVIQSEPKATSSSNIYELWGGVGAVTLSLLGWLWWRKRKLDERTSQNLFASSSMSKATESRGFFTTSIEKDTERNADAGGGKRPFFGESTLGDFDSFDTGQGEIDPISEADVYMAYGRYQQAEELMRDVIKDQPNRDECKLKLLKIFYSNQNKDAFETYANELANEGKKDDVEFWAKVTEMGSEICKDSTLFSSEVDGLSSKENTTFENKTLNLVEFNDIEKNQVADVKENNFSLSSFGESVNNEAVKEIPQTTDSLLDFDLISVEDEVIDEQKNNESIDFDLSQIATKIEESSGSLEKVVSKTPDVEVNDGFESYDYDFDSNEIEVKEIGEIDTSVVKEPVENSQITDSLTDESFSLSSNFTNNFLDGNFYFDKPLSGSNGEDFDQKDELDVFDLTDTDDLETKLDLAKAYIDMNDSDAAKDMICEVLEKGTAEQKKVAQALLKDLK